MANNRPSPPHPSEGVLQADKPSVTISRTIREQIRFWCAACMHYTADLTCSWHGFSAIVQDVRRAGILLLELFARIRVYTCHYSGIWHSILLTRHHRIASGVNVPLALSLCRCNGPHSTDYVLRGFATSRRGPDKLDWCGMRLCPGSLMLVELCSHAALDVLW